MKKRPILLVAAAAVIGLWLAAMPQPASATVLIIDLNVEFSGDTAPAGTAPWVIMTLDDGGTADSVTLTIQNVGLRGLSLCLGSI